MTLIDFWRSHAAEVMTLLSQHVKLVCLSTAIATCIGVPLGIFAARNPRSGAPLVWLANVAQTIPSLAMFGFLLPLPFIGGLGARVATIVLVLYALLPIIRTTSAGLLAVDPALLEAGTALGMTPRQRLLIVELPLALPSIVAGIRVAAVIELLDRSLDLRLELRADPRLAVDHARDRLQADACECCDVEHRGTPRGCWRVC